MFMVFLFQFFEGYFSNLGLILNYVHFIRRNFQFESPEFSMLVANKRDCRFRARNPKGLFKSTMLNFSLEISIAAFSAVPKVRRRRSCVVRILARRIRGRRVRRVWRRSESSVVGVVQNSAADGEMHFFIFYLNVISAARTRIFQLKVLWGNDKSFDFISKVNFPRAVVIFVVSGLCIKIRRGNNCIWVNFPAACSFEFSLMPS